MYLDEKSTYQEFALVALSFFSAINIADLLFDSSKVNFGTKLTFAVLVLSLVAVIFKKNYLNVVLLPVSLVAISLNISNNTLNLDKGLVSVVFLGSIFYGLYKIKGKIQTATWFAAISLGIWLIVFATKLTE